MKKTFLIFALFTSGFLFAQTEDAWVYFTDKPNVAASIANPITILTQAAIDRKNLHNTPIDVRDVPVNEAYISQIKSVPGITYLAKSKWFNCVYVRGTSSDIFSLGNLSFVDHIVFADPTLNSSPLVKSPSVHTNFHKNKLEVQTNFVYGNSANQVQMIAADYLHQQGFTGEGITMAILDAGFHGVNTLAGFQRMRTNGDLLDGYDFVDRNANEFSYNGNTHGTMVLSTISGYIANQYVGTAPDASVYLFRTEDAGSETPVEMAYWVEAAERADSLGVFVINTSLGYSTFDNPNYSFSPSDMDGNTAFISKGASVAFEKGMLLVTSAGNEGDNSWGIVTAPADSPGAFTIGAVDAAGNYASFSSTGPTSDGRTKPDLAAQGASAAVIAASGTIITASGTSFSSPITAGAIASLWQADPGKTNLEIMQLVRQSASQYANPDNFLGDGIPNFQLALAQLSREEKKVKNPITIYPNPVNDQLFIEVSPTITGGKLQLFTLTGKKAYESAINNKKTSLDLSNLPAGLYLVKIPSNETSSVFKIVKE